jgi:Tol biopolymer transport system component
VAFQRASDIWVRDIEKGVDSRLTSHPAMETFPVWSPDGRTIAFQSSRDGVLNLYARAVGVVGEDKEVLKSETGIVPGDWSRDGRYIVFNSPRLGAPNDIWALPLSGDGKPRRLTETPFLKYAVRISPDSRWIAFLSNESKPDLYQLYVQSFPEPGAKQQISTNGAFQPRWSADGKELSILPPTRL